MMAEELVQTRKKPEKPDLTPEQYAEFIHQMELNRIWLKETSAVNRLGPVRPARTKNDLKVELQEWEPLDGGFRAVQAIRVKIWDRQHISDSEAAGLPPADVEITVAFAVDYLSKLPMTDAIFSKFKSSNLPLNTWPYFRELVSNTTARMNWVDFYMPTFKSGTRPRGTAEAGQATAAKRRAAAKKDE